MDNFSKLGISVIFGLLAVILFVILGNAFSIIFWKTPMPYIAILGVPIIFIGAGLTTFFTSFPTKFEQWGNKVE